MTVKRFHSITKSLNGKFYIGDNGHTPVCKLSDKFRLKFKNFNEDYSETEFLHMFGEWEFFQEFTLKQFIDSYGLNFSCLFFEVGENIFYCQKISDNNFIIVGNTFGEILTTNFQGLIGIFSHYPVVLGENE